MFALTAQGLFACFDIITIVLPTKCHDSFSFGTVVYHFQIYPLVYLDNTLAGVADKAFRWIRAEIAYLACRGIPWNLHWMLKIFRPTRRRFPTIRSIIRYFGEREWMALMR